MVKFNNTPNEAYAFPLRKKGGIEITGWKTVWDSRSVAAEILVWDGRGRALIAHRGKGVDHYPDLWCQPCGYLDRGETIVQCARRELWEETNLLLPEWMFHFYDVNDDPAKDANQNVTFHYFVILRGNDIRVSSKNAASGEIQALRWIQPREVKNYSFVKDHGTRIENFRRIA